MGTTKPQIFLWWLDYALASCTRYRCNTGQRTYPVVWSNGKKYLHDKVMGTTRTMLQRRFRGLTIRDEFQMKANRAVRELVTGIR